MSVWPPKVIRKSVKPKITYTVNERVSLCNSTAVNGVLGKFSFVLDTDCKCRLAPLFRTVFT